MIQRVFLAFVCLRAANSLSVLPLAATKFRQASQPSTYRTDSSLKVYPLPFPLVKANDYWGNWAALTGTAATAQYLGKKTAVGRLLGPPVTAMALSFLLATIGVLNPGGSDAAKALQILSLQLATPLVLLGADLRDAVSQCGPLLVSFFTASLATLVACLLGWAATGQWLTAALGLDGLVIAAALMAKNIGGGINYVAVCRSLGASPSAVAAGLCVDNIFALIYFPATSALGSGRPDLVDKIDGDQSTEKDDSRLDDSISVQNLSTILCLSSSLLWAGESIGGKAGALPICTLLTVLLASRAPRQWLRPLQPTADVMGTLCLYLFFSTAGAPGIAVADSVRASLLPLGVFLTILYSIHGLILTLFCKIAGKRFAAFKAQRLLVASSAAIGGPATAVALARASGWGSLTLPSLLVGNAGYAIATFCGLGFYHALFR